MDELTKIAHEISDKYFPHTLEVGLVTTHPDGRTVKILSGYYRDPVYGRVSNWWTWVEIIDDNVVGMPESGYGW